MSNSKLELNGERYLPEVGWGVRIALEHIHRYLMACSFAKGKKVLDIACGEGYGSAMMAEVAQHVSGVDISADAVNHALGKYHKENLSFLVGSCDSIPLPDESVDLIVSFETIEHHDRHEEMMQEFKRVLKRNGVLIISSPDKYEFSDIGRQSTHYHVKELYRDEFEQLVRSTFKNVAIAGQRLVSGSGIFVEDSITRICNYSDEQLLKQVNSGLSHPLYSIAIASDAKLPEMISGLLETSQNKLILLEELIQKREQDFLEKDRLLDQRNLEVIEKDEMLHQRNLEVIEKEKILHQRNLEVIEKDEMLHQRNLEVIEKDKMLHQRNLEVIEKDEMLHQRNLEVLEKNEQLHQRNLDIAVLEESLKLANRSLLAKLKDKLSMNSLSRQ